MSLYDAFMLDDIDRGLSKLKLTGILTDVDGYELYHVTENDIRLCSHSTNNIYISILHSRYNYEYMKQHEWDIVQGYTPNGYFTLHNGLILGSRTISNVIITYLVKDLIEKLTKDGIL